MWFGESKVLYLNVFLHGAKTCTRNMLFGPEPWKTVASWTILVFRSTDREHWLFNLYSLFSLGQKLKHYIAGLLGGHYCYFPFAYQYIYISIYILWHMKNVLRCNLIPFGYPNKKFFI